MLIHSDNGVEPLTSRDGIKTADGALVLLPGKSYRNLPEPPGLGQA